MLFCRRASDDEDVGGIERSCDLVAGGKVRIALRCAFGGPHLVLNDRIEDDEDDDDAKREAPRVRAVVLLRPFAATGEKTNLELIVGILVEKPDRSM